MFDFKFDWQPGMATGIEEIDTQHKQLLSMGREIEQLLQINCIGVTQKQLLDIICGFRNFTGYHFYTEESLMGQCGYAKAPAHHLEHQKFIDMVMNYDVPAMKENPVKALEEAREILQTLIFNHMLTSDQEFAKAYKSWMNLHSSQLEAEKEEKQGDWMKYGKKIAELDVTRAILLNNQSYRGHVVLINKDKRTSFSQLTALERSALSGDVTKMTAALRKALKPDAFDYAIYEDVDEFLMCHIIPKYKEDPNFGKPFDYDTQKILLYHEYDELLDKIQQQIK